MADMVRYFNFTTRDYASLISGASDLLFFDHTKAADEKLSAKIRLWYNALEGNVRPSMAESAQLLAIEGGLHNVK